MEQADRNMLHAAFHVYTILLRVRLAQEHIRQDTNSVQAAYERQRESNYLKALSVQQY